YVSVFPNDISLPSYGQRGNTEKPHLILPPQKCRAPGETAAHRLQKYEIAAFDAAIRDSVGERKRDRSRRRVAVAIERHHNFFGRDAELVDGAVDDALVGLMRHEPVDIVGGVASVTEH